MNTLLNSGQPVSRATLEATSALYGELGGDVLGLRLDGTAAEVASLTDAGLLDGLVQMLIGVREEARQARDWAKADAIRDRLLEMGVSLEDGPPGTRWRLSR